MRLFPLVLPVKTLYTKEKEKKYEENNCILNVTYIIARSKVPK